MQRSSVLKLAVALLFVVGAGVVVSGIGEESVALSLLGLGLAIQAVLFYLADRRARATQQAVVKQLARTEQAILKQVADQLARAEEASVEKQTLAAEHLDRIGVRMDTMQRRLVASIDSARLEASQRAGTAG